MMKNPFHYLLIYLITDWCWGKKKIKTKDRQMQLIQPEGPNTSYVFH